MSFTDPTLTGQAQEVEDPNQLLAMQEGGYDAPSVETDQDAIAEQVYTDLAGRAPGWQAHDGNLDTWIIESFSEAGAEIRALAGDVPASIFQTYGQNVLGIPPGLDAGATGTADFTAVDDQGYTLDIGSVFSLARSGNDQVAFQTLAEAAIAPGATTVADVPFVAVETGADTNGLSGAGTMVDPVTWVTGIQVDTATANGADAETPEDYLNRLTNLMSMMALRPVLPQDFAILAMQNPGVSRAVAMNLYDPADGSWDNERTVTLLLTNDEGLPCDADTKTAVIAQLEELREVNWVINVIDATYSTIAVTFDVVAFAGQNATTVHDACVTAVTNYLNPATFRLGAYSPATAGGEVIPPPDSGQPARCQVIRVNELIALLDRTAGVDYVVSIEINGADADYQLPTATTLPEPGAIDGTVEGASP